MKKIHLAVIAIIMTVFSANAQVKIESPHPDLDVKITRCAYTSGTVIIDLVITNFGIEDEICFMTVKPGNHSATFMYDDEGNSYSANDTEILFGTPNKQLKGGWVRNSFPQDIPIKYRVQFDGINSNASKFTLVKIGLSSNGPLSLNVDKPLIIRNLEWVK